ncbi:MNNG and nitrosoguanidine resistance protein [Microdochium bolleyi]|uniref:MNNG and nitrosoguanidine resistance protein n=1 Tax=Microdochium bolleyi TaxID=196109 RepID=A0A136JHW2_9PEZI|nr:MNNG and nitrosoguanidine resistance protein [Microdochium bolleyi]
MAPPRREARRANTPDASAFVLAARDDNNGNDNRQRNDDSSEQTIWGRRSSNNNNDNSAAAGRRRHDGHDHHDDFASYATGGGTDGYYTKPHESVGFWHHKMSKVRKHVLLMWARTILILIVAIMGVLSLYWGVLYNAEDRLRNFVVYVVDFDGQVAPYDTEPNPFVGETMVNAALGMVNNPAQKMSLGYTVVNPAEFDFNPTAVRQAVYDWRCWAAVIVHPNATALLREAVAVGNASYSPAGSVQYVYQTARQDTATYNYIRPALDALTTSFGAQFGRQWSEQLMSNASLSRQTMAQAPAAINPGISPLPIDLRPFQPATVTASVSIGLIYLIITSFFSFSFFLPIHMKYIQPQGHPPLHFWQFIIWRWIATIVAYFFVSLGYSLVSLAMQVPFWMPPASPTEVAFNPTAYGLASFPVWWMINFLGMVALGFASENVAMVVGQPWAALWLIFWVITNVTTSFYAYEVIPTFYSWGYAWPLHSVVEASRHILFDLKSDIGKDIGILLAWGAVNTAFFPLCCYIMRWKTEREQRMQEKNKDQYVVKTEDGEKHLPKDKGEKPPLRKRGFMRGV